LGDVELGLRDAELARVLSSEDADRLAAVVSNARGNGEWLRRILWWGTAVADVRGPVDARVRSDAGRFNLAFALFDSVVDERPTLTPHLAAALEPRWLRARLEDPVGEGAALATKVGGLRPLVQLFDDALVGVGRRLSAEPKRTARLADMLELMFRSELRLSADPFVAKVLPVTFIGELVGDEPATARLFRRLAEFCWLWDDWLDLAEDLARRRPNVFLGRRSMLVGAGRLVAAKRSQAEIATRLSECVAASVRAAAEIGEGALERTAALYRELFA
jgi:hypothetical protein